MSVRVGMVGVGGQGVRHLIRLSQIEAALQAVDQPRYDAEIEQASIAILNES